MSYKKYGHDSALSMEHTTELPWVPWAMHLPFCVFLTLDFIAVSGFLQVILQHTIDGNVTVGLLFVILSALLFIIAFLRSRHSAHDFADRYRGATEFDVCIKTKGQEGGRIYGRPFKTAGWIVIEVTTVVALAEIALLALIVQHKISVSLNHAFRSSTLTKIPLSCQT